MSESESEDFNNQASIQARLGASLLKSIKASEKYLDETAIEALLQRLSKISTIQSVITQYENFSMTLLLKIESLKQLISIDIEKGDYQNLQTAVQKAEAEIRGHIKIEQQLKIYMDGLEDRVEELEKQLKKSQDKYKKLYETLRVVDAEKKQLKRKLNTYELKFKSQDLNLTGSNLPAHKHSKVISQHSAQDSQSSLQKIYLQKARATRIKSIIPKYSQKKHRMVASFINEDNTNKKKHIKSELQISMVQLEGVKKEQNNKVTTKQPTRTIRLKQMQGKSQTKSGKYLNGEEGLRQKGKREARSNSVCA